MALTITSFSGGITEVAPSQSLVDTSNYLYSLCNKYGVFAQNIISTGGQVAPATPITFEDIADFYVTSESFIVTGQSTKTISGYVGYDLLFIRNGVPQSTANTGGGESYYSWSRTTGNFFCYPAAVEGELFQLKAVV